MLTARPIFSTSTCFFLVSILFLNIRCRLYDISPYLCLPLKLKPSLFRFTARPLGYRGRRDPQPLHDRFHPLFCLNSYPFHTTGATYLVLQLCGGTSLSVGLTFVINLSYLLAGYWYTSSLLTLLVSKLFSHLRYNGQEYDVSWTMPQCVLCLRLIGQFC